MEFESTWWHPNAKCQFCKQYSQISQHAVVIQK